MDATYSDFQDIKLKLEFNYLQLIVKLLNHKLLLYVVHMRTK